MTRMLMIAAITTCLLSARDIVVKIIRSQEREGNSEVEAEAMASIPLGGPFYRGSAHYYNVAIPFSAGIPYRPLYSSRPTPSSSKSMNNLHDPLACGVVDNIPCSNWHGMGMPIGYRAMGPRNEFFLNDKAPQLCNTLRPEKQPPITENKSKHNVPAGSWKCEMCNNVNYPFRTKCNRYSCGAIKPSDGRISGGDMGSAHL
ncbi:hypothetical protein PIB30_047336 [Stylosanthes scabra]|uniref:RanBP2-type domain-containing protein n=1 Tax=Stylosanthes scabra TaxID=79078 RepID=A0ABU6RGS3_9FABA|nr:hypothetical protein [Stylosanthes scabra]